MNFKHASAASNSYVTHIYNNTQNRPSSFILFQSITDLPPAPHAPGSMPSVPVAQRHIVKNSKRTRAHDFPDKSTAIMSPLPGLLTFSLPHPNLCSLRMKAITCNATANQRAPLGSRPSAERSVSKTHFCTKSSIRSVATSAAPWVRESALFRPPRPIPSRSQLQQTKVFNSKKSKLIVSQSSAGTL